MKMGKPSADEAASAQIPGEASWVSVPGEPLLREQQVQGPACRGHSRQRRGQQGGGGVEGEGTLGGGTGFLLAQRFF